MSGNISTVELVFIVIGAGLFFAIRRLRSARRPAAPGRRYNRILRGISVLVGLGLVAGVWHGTLLDVRRTHDAGTVDESQVPRATRPAPDLPDPGEVTERQIPAETGRVLVHLVWAEEAGQKLRPMHVESFDFSWPAMRGVRQSRALAIDGMTLEAELQLNGLRLYRATPDGPFELRPDLSISLSARKLGSMSGMGSSINDLEESFNAPRAGGRHNAILSIYPSPDRELKVISLVRPVASDDPLEDVSLEEFVAAEQGAFERLAPKTPSANLGRDRIPINGLGLFYQAGVAGLLLILAAWLLAQPFRHRSLPFAALLIGVVLLIAGLERRAVDSHIAVMSDGAASIEHRITACGQAGSTLLYRDRATSALVTVAEDRDAPEALRSHATRAAEQLSVDR